MEAAFEKDFYWGAKSRGGEGEKRQPRAGQFPFRPGLLQTPRPGRAPRVPEAEEAQAEDSGLQAGRRAREQMCVCVGPAGGAVSGMQTREHGSVWRNKRWFRGDP